MVSISFWCCTLGFLMTGAKKAARGQILENKNLWRNRTLMLSTIVTSSIQISSYCKPVFVEFKVEFETSIKQILFFSSQLDHQLIPPCIHFHTASEQLYLLSLFELKMVLEKLSFPFLCFQKLRFGQEKQKMFSKFALCFDSSEMHLGAVKVAAFHFAFHFAFSYLLLFLLVLQ